jgi:ArsR family transcriptional regulator
MLRIELMELLRKANFRQVEVAMVHREAEAPHFETLLAMAEKPR